MVEFRTVAQMLTRPDPRRRRHFDILFVYDILNRGPGLKRMNQERIIKCDQNKMIRFTRFSCVILCLCVYCLSLFFTFRI